MVLFDELFIAFRTLYGPMNLGMSFHALCFGNTKFLVDRYTKSFIWCSMLDLWHLLNSVFPLFCSLELCCAHLVDSIQLFHTACCANSLTPLNVVPVDICCPDCGIYP